MQSTIRKTFLAAMLALSAVGADAIPAYPGKIKARQADGTEIIIHYLVAH